MPLLLIGAVLGGGTVWFVSDAGDKLAKIALVGGGVWLAYKYLK